LLCTPGIQINALTKDKRHFTALHCACEQGRWDVATQLLQCKADLKAVAAAAHPKDVAEVAHPLSLLTRCVARLGPHAADCSSAAEVARQLLKLGKPSKASLESAAASLCDLALWASGHSEAFEATSSLLSLLGEAGLDRHAALGPALLGAVEGALGGGLAGDRRNDHRVAQAKAAGISLMDTPEIVGLALQLGAHPHACNSSKDTSLHLLLRFPSQCRSLPHDHGCGEAIARTVGMLLENKASLNAKNSHGETPLSIAKDLFDMGENYGRLWKDIMPAGSRALKTSAFSSSGLSSSGPASSQDKLHARSPENKLRNALPDISGKRAAGDSDVYSALGGSGAQGRAGSKGSRGSRGSKGSPKQDASPGCLKLPALTPR